MVFMDRKDLNLKKKQVVSAISTAFPGRLPPAAVGTREMSADDVGSDRLGRVGIRARSISADSRSLPTLGVPRTFMLGVGKHFFSQI